MTRHLLSNHAPRTLTLLLAATVLAACGASSVVVQGSFPTPNISKLPVRVAVVYEEELRGHTYTEHTDRGDEEYLVESGAAHIRLFDAILPAMFAEVVEASSIEEAAALGVDAIFCADHCRVSVSPARQNPAGGL